MIVDGVCGIHWWWDSWIQWVEGEAEVVLWIVLETCCQQLHIFSFWISCLDHLEPPCVLDKPWCRGYRVTLPCLPTDTGCSQPMLCFIQGANPMDSGHLTSQMYCGVAELTKFCSAAKWARIHYWRTWAHSAMCWWGMVWIVVHFSPHSVHQLTLLLPCLNPRSHVSDHLARHYEAWSIIPIIFQMNSRLQPTHSDREIWLSMLESWPLLPRRTRYDCCMCCCDKCIGAPLKVHRV